MIFYGVKPGGTETALPAPAQARLDAKDDAPADSFAGVFPMRKSAGPLTGIRIRDEKGGLRFDGVTDIRRENAAGNGTVLKLSARSRAGLLLDSEAMPQSYEYPSLPAIYARHVKPYGFAGWKGSDRVFDGTLRITKGMSEWQAAALFCETFLRIPPRVRGGIFDASGEAEQAELRFDNSHGVKYYSAEVRDRCCDRYSALFAPDGAGGYAPAATDAQTVSLGIARNRFLAKGAADARALMRAADRKAFAVTVDCPGELPAEPGQPAAFRDPVLGEYGGLTVSEVCFSADSDGVRTRAVLRKN